MPYIVVKDGGDGACPASRPFGVYRETKAGSGQPTGDPHGCHPTREKALAQLRALYANVPDAKSEVPAMPTKVPHTIAARRARLPRPGDLEHRTLPIEALEVRDSDYMIRGENGDERRLLLFEGHASLFNRSYRVGSYVEKVAPGAFQRSLGNRDLDVVLRTEHADLPLARTTGRETLADGTEIPTLRLSEDTDGLRVRALLDPMDPDVQRLVPKYRRGDLKEMSFAFRVQKGGDEWSEDYAERTIRAADIHRGDVSIVTYGASPTTTSTMRSERAVDELRSIGAEGLVGSLQDFAFQWVGNFLARNGRDQTLEELEARAGRILSSTSLDTLRTVLGLISDADDAVDQAQPLLADLMGVPNPDDDDDADEQNSARDANERRDAPTPEDWGIMQSLKTAKLTLADAKGKQLADPDYDSDPDDKTVMTQIEAAEAAIDKAIVAQGKDGRPDGETERGDVTVEANADGSITLRGEGPARDVILEALGRAQDRDVTHGSIVADGAEVYWRRQFSAAERKRLAKSGAAMPSGEFPIVTKQDLSNAIQTVGRASDPAAAKAHIKKRAKALGATSMLPEDWRSASMPKIRSIDEIELELRTIGSRR